MRERAKADVQMDDVLDKIHGIIKLAFLPLSEFPFNCPFYCDIIQPILIIALSNKAIVKNSNY